MHVASIIMDVTPNNGNRPELSQIVCEFLEAAVHSILHVRDLYPSEVFERRRYCGVPIQWVRHPGLRDYIHQTVNSLRTWIQQGIVEKIALVVHDRNMTLVERFIFSLGVDTAYSVDDLPLTEMEYALRAFLIKISVSESLLGTLPPDCTWEFLAYSKEIPENASTVGSLWVSAESGELGEAPELIPIKSLARGPLQLQLYVEKPSSCPSSSVPV